MTMSIDAPYSSTEQHPEHVEQLLRDHDDQTFSFVELVLYATEFSEDETEVGDLVDAMFDSGFFPLDDLPEERIALAGISGKTHATDAHSRAQIGRDARDRLAGFEGGAGALLEGRNTDCVAFGDHHEEPGMPVRGHQIGGADQAPQVAGERIAPLGEGLRIEVITKRFDRLDGHLEQSEAPSESVRRNSSHAESAAA